MEPIQSTNDLGQLKAELALETNRKAELNKLLRTAGTDLLNSKKSVLDAWDAFQKIKNEIKCAEDRIKTLKTIIRSEGICGG